MNDIPKQKLCEIITTYGTVVCSDPRKVEGLLRDYCGEYRREIFVIISAMKERVAEELLALPKGISLEIQITRLEKRLVDNLALANDAASWAVKTWALALGVEYPVSPPQAYSQKTDTGGQPDARGVSKIYQGRVKFRYLLQVSLAGIVIIGVVLFQMDWSRNVIRTFWLQLKILFGF